MEQLTASQLAEWEVYSTIDPIGDWRIELSLAYGLSTIANILLKAHFKGGSGFKVEDFLLDWSGEMMKKQSAEQMKEVLTQFAREQNKRVARQTGNLSGIRKSKRLSK